VSWNPLKALNWRFCRIEKLISNFSLVDWQWKRKVLLSVLLVSFSFSPSLLGFIELSTMN
jgi:hypothetical protein